MPVLAQEPGVPVADLDELLGIGAAMESEAVQLYAALEAEMTRQGVHKVAAVFGRLVAMEQHHVGTIAAFGQEILGHSISPFRSGEAAVRSRVTRPTADEAASMALTPYRALSIAVHTEERAFAFYTYLAATTADPAVRQYAEILASEELHHAALLRKERRQAYHREPRRPPLPVPETLDELASLTTGLQGEIEFGNGTPPRQNDDKKGLWEAVRRLERQYEIYGRVAERTGSEAVMAEALLLAQSVLVELALARQRLTTPNTATRQAAAANFQQ